MARKEGPRHGTYKINLVLAYEEWLAAGTQSAFDLDVIRSARGPCLVNLDSGFTEHMSHMPGVVFVSKVGKVLLPFGEARMSVLHPQSTGPVSVVPVGDVATEQVMNLRK